MEEGKRGGSEGGRGKDITGMEIHMGVSLPLTYLLYTHTGSDGVRTVSQR